MLLGLVSFGEGEKFGMESTPFQSSKVELEVPFVKVPSQAVKFVSVSERIGGVDTALGQDGSCGLISLVRMVDGPVSDATRVDEVAFDPVAVGVVAEVPVAALGDFLIVFAQGPTFAKILALFGRHRRLKIEEVLAVPAKQASMI